ncbi:hypothetical protein [Leuconostoc citreum]|uniref:hypothetical protein n=1 Tax=Leuconostoc citreum TaxID=33964 RepID=UPI003C4EDDDB
MKIFDEEDLKFMRNLEKSYYDDDVQVVLIKGFCDDDKLFDTIALATQINDEPKILLRTGYFKYTQDLVQRAVSSYLPNSKISFNSKKPFIFNKKYIYVDKWNQNNYLPIREDFSIYYPIQSVVAQGGESDLEKLKSAISNDHSKLIILVTTNDVKEGYLDFSLLDGIVDKSFVLDSTKKHPETYSVILNNLNEDKIFYE